MHLLDVQSPLRLRACHSCRLLPRLRLRGARASNLFGFTGCRFFASGVTDKMHSPGGLLMTFLGVNSRCQVRSPLATPIKSHGITGSQFRRARRAMPAETRCRTTNSVPCLLLRPQTELPGRYRLSCRTCACPPAHKAYRLRHRRPELNRWLRPRAPCEPAVSCSTGLALTSMHVLYTQSPTGLRGRISAAFSQTVHGGQ
jgi:hypothetical protein